MFGFGAGGADADRAPEQRRPGDRHAPRRSPLRAADRRAPRDRAAAAATRAVAEGRRRADRQRPARSRRRGALHATRRLPTSGGRGAQRRRRHADRLGQDALLQPARSSTRSPRTRRRGRSTSSPPRRWPRTSSSSCARWPRRPGIGLKTHTYDGDTPANVRAVRAAGQVVITNPDMLHSAILPHHTKWFKLFENLQFVVIDELHTYRGLFGSHVANVIRRLRRDLPPLRRRPDLHLRQRHHRQPARARRAACSRRRSS